MRRQLCRVLALTSAAAPGPCVHSGGLGTAVPLAAGHVASEPTFTRRALGSSPASSTGLHSCSAFERTAVLPNDNEGWSLPAVAVPAPTVPPSCTVGSCARSSGSSPTLRAPHRLHHPSAVLQSQDAGRRLYRTAANFSTSSSSCAGCGNSGPMHGSAGVAAAVAAAAVGAVAIAAPWAAEGADALARAKRTTAAGYCGDEGMGGCVFWPRRLALQNERPRTPGASGNSTDRGTASNAATSSSGSSSSAAGTRGKGSGSGAGTATRLSEGSAFAVYDAHGEPSSWEALLASLPGAAVVLLGEYHDDPVAHHLQLELLRHTLGQGPGGQGSSSHGAGGATSSSSGSSSSSRSGGAAGPAGQHVSQGQGQGKSHGRQRLVALSLEMFETDVQHVMDEFLRGHIREADLVKDARPWPNYQSDYRPLVMAARDAGAPVVCANAPRRYVSLVGRSGAAALEALPPASRAHLPPLPLRPASEVYAAKIQWTMQRAREPATGEEEADDGEERAPPVPAAVAKSHASQPPPQPTARPASAPNSSSNAAGASASAADTSSGTAAAAATAAAAGGAASGTTSADASAARGGGECPYSGMSLGRSRFVEAQNLWDAAMAHAIARALEALPPGGLVVHVCGKFHSEQRLGICEHLEHIWGSGGAAATATAATPATVAAPAAAPNPASSPAATAPSAETAATEVDLPASGPGLAPKVCVVTFVPSGRGVCVPPETLRGARLHTYGDWLVLTDGRLPRSFESEHPV